MNRNFNGDSGDLTVRPPMTPRTGQPTTTKPSQNQAIQRGFIHQVAPNPGAPTSCSVLINNRFPPRPGFTLPAGTGSIYVAGTVLIPTTTTMFNGPWYNDPVTLKGGTQVLVNTDTMSIVEIQNGTSTVVPSSAAQLISTHVHTGGVDGNGNPLPGQIDNTQLKANPNPTVAPTTKAPSPTITGYVGANGTISTGAAYEAIVAFSLVVPTNTSWLTELRTYAIPHATSLASATLTTISQYAQKTTLAPQSSGNYATYIHGLISGIAYDIYVATVDLQGNLSPGRFLITTTANPASFSVSQATMGDPTLITPAVSSHGTEVSLSGTVSFDYKVPTTTLDANGYNTILWLREIELVYRNHKSLTDTLYANSASPLASGTYDLIYPALPLGLNSDGTPLVYDLGIRYIDYKGQRSNVDWFDTVTAGTLAIGRGNLPVNPTPSAAPALATPVPAITGYVGVTGSISTGGAYDAIVTFNTTLTNPVWLEELRIFSVPNSVSAATASFANVGQYSNKATLTVDSGGHYSTVVHGLVSGIQYDVYATFVDFQGNMTPGAFLVTTSANPVNFAPATMGDPTLITPMVTSHGTDVTQNGTVGTVAFDYLVPTVALDANGYNTNRWIAEIELVFRNEKVSNNIMFANALSPQASGTYQFVYPQLPVGTNSDNSTIIYDLGVRYVDYKGQRSNVDWFDAVTSPSLSVNKANFYGNPNPTVAPATTTPVPAITAYIGANGTISTGGAYDAIVTFNTVIYAPSWLEELRAFAVPHATSNAADPFASVGQYAHKSTIAVSSTGQYTTVIHGLVSGVAYDIYVAFVDFQGVLTPGKFLVTTQANPVSFGSAAMASMGDPSTVTPGAPIFGTGVAQNGQPGSTAFDYFIPNFGGDTLALNSNPWLAEIELVYRNQKVTTSILYANSISPGPGGVYYQIVYPQLPVGTNSDGTSIVYDLGFRYVDYKGQRSNSYFFTSVAASSLLTSRSNYVGNPNPNTAPTISTSPAPAITAYIGANGTISTGGAYDAIVTFTTALTNPVWLEELRTFAIPKTTSNSAATLSTVGNYAQKTTLAVSGSGSYTTVIHGLVSGVAYDIYVAMVDFQGAMTPGSFLITTLPNPVSFGSAAMASMGATPSSITPTVNSHGTDAPQNGQPGSTAFDYLVPTVSLDANGYSTNTWLAEIELVYRNNVVPANVLFANSLSPIASGTYQFTYPQLPVGVNSDGSAITYGLGVQYVDYRGQRSAPLFFDSVLASSLQTTRANYAGNPNPTVAPDVKVTPAPAITGYIGANGTISTGGSYDAIITFSTGTTNPGWLEELRTFAIPNTTSGAAATFALVGQYAQKTTLAVSSSGDYATVIHGLIAGVRYDIYTTFVDFQGAMTPGKFVITTATNPVSFGSAAMASMGDPSTVTPGAPIFGTGVAQNGQPGSTAFDYFIPNFGGDTLALNSNPWLAEIELVYRNQKVTTSILYANSISPGPGGVYYQIVYPQLPVGTNSDGTSIVYDLGFRYVDYKGQRSNSYFFTSVAASALVTNRQNYAGNPNPNTAPAISSTPAVPTITGYVGANGTISSGGAYDATITFNTALTNPVWLEELRTFAIPNPTSGAATTYANVGQYAQKTTLAVDPSGHYASVIHGLVAGVAYDIYVAFVDFQGAITPGSFLNTTAANPVAFGASASASMGTPSSVTPGVPTMGTGAFQNGQPGSTAFDYSLPGVTPDSLGYGTNNWLYEIELVYRNHQNLNDVMFSNAVSPIASGTYTFIFQQLPVGTNSDGSQIIYDLGYRYVDFAGQRSNTRVITSINSSSLTVGAPSLQGIPNGTSFTADYTGLTTPYFTISSNNSSTFSTLLNFNLRITSTVPYTQWLDKIQLLAKVSTTGTSDGDTNPANYLKVGQIAGASFTNPIQHSFGPLATDQIWQLAVQLVDHSGYFTIADPIFITGLQPSTPILLPGAGNMNFIGDSDMQFTSNTGQSTYWSYAGFDSTRFHVYPQYRSLTADAHGGANVGPVCAYSDLIEVITGQVYTLSVTSNLDETHSGVQWAFIVNRSEKDANNSTPASIFAQVQLPRTGSARRRSSISWTATFTGQIAVALYANGISGSCNWIAPQFELGPTASTYKPGTLATNAGATISHTAQSTAVQQVISQTAQVKVDNVQTGSRLPLTAHAVSVNDVVVDPGTGRGQLVVSPVGGVTGNLPLNNHDPVHNLDLQGWQANFVADSDLRFSSNAYWYSSLSSGSLYISIQNYWGRNAYQINSGATPVSGLNFSPCSQGTLATGLQPSVTYTFSAFCDISLSVGNFGLIIMNGQTNTEIGRITCATGASRKSFTFVAPTGCTSVYLLIQPNITSASTAAYCGQFQLELGTSMTSYRSTTADTKLGYFARGAHHPDIINTVALGGGIDYQSSLHRNTLPRNKHDTSFQSAINASGGLDFSYPYHYNRLPIGSHAIGIQNAVDGNSGDLKQSTISGLTMVNSGTWKNTYRVDVNAAKSNFGGASNIGLTPGEWYTLDCVINDQTASGGGSGVAPGFWDVANSGFLADFYSGAGSLLFYHSGTYITSTALGANTVNDGRWHRITLKMCYLGSGVIRHVAFADGVKVADFNYTYPFLGPVLPGFSSGAAGYMYIQPGWDFSIHGDQPVMSSNFANQQSSMLPTVSNFIFNYTFDTSNVMTWSIYGYPTTGSAPTFIYPDGSTVTAVATSGTYDTGASSQAVWALIYWNLKTNSWNIQFQISPFSIAQVATAFGDGLVAMLARFGSNAMVAGRSGTSGTGSIGGGKQGIAFN